MKRTRNPLGPDRPMRGNYGDNPFKLMVEPRDAALQRDIEKDRQSRGVHLQHFTEGPLDLRGMGSWTTLFTWGVSPFTWGIVWANVQANDRTTGAAAALDRAVAEVQVIGVFAGTRTVLVSCPLASYQSFEFSDGLLGGLQPLTLRIYPGEMPDNIEVQARAWRAGALMTDVNANETLSLSATGRFYRE